MIDLTYLDDITDGDNATRRQLIELFFTQVDEIRQRFIIAQLSDNIDEISKTAHIAKSTMMVMGINNIAEKMEKLQHLSEKKEAPETYKEFINNFLTEIPIAILELKKELKRIS